MKAVTKQKKTSRLSKATHGRAQAGDRDSVLQDDVDSAKADMFRRIRNKFLNDDKSEMMAVLDEAHKERKRELENLIGELQKELIAKKDDLSGLALAYLGAGQLPSAPPYKTPKGVKAAKVEALNWNLQKCIGHLESLADNGDKEAIQILAQHTLHLSQKSHGLPLLMV